MEKLIKQNLFLVHSAILALIFLVLTNVTCFTIRMRSTWGAAIPFLLLIYNLKCQTKKRIWKEMLSSWSVLDWHVLGCKFSASTA